ncbi:hypothetical protein [Leptospira borgpetersenii]|uniref:Uncharacterized protein n=1 Tax=Leptospira borgpetersenii str. Brem 328 TaxID=1049780 RepID=A0ABC9SEM8_LEPBO|nr:hypothetical protein LEP1GSC055_0386 [Leptospira borgpetersenii str. Brem 307]EMN16249.1 hypothetical protein LEP1GSC056_0507 [Leptospira borgpetersenii str. Brem 328]
MNLIPGFYNNLTGIESPVRSLLTKAGFAQTFLYWIHVKLSQKYLRMIGIGVLSKDKVFLR